MFGGRSFICDQSADEFRLKSQICSDIHAFSSNNFLKLSNSILGFWTALDTCSGIWCRISSAINRFDRRTSSAFLLPMNQVKKTEHSLGGPAFSFLVGVQRDFWCWGALRASDFHPLLLLFVLVDPPQLLQ
ncbi:Uncharacterized protein APZ42_032968 [Daphnia magna]|uniref:Uncharacterized protein n=1 Tax=Daphnia magna TaxID=35525 RepID=A0A162D8C6_9CRUS|nr:Uncharacterized protein APZ42_032968 [Daphnia magna]